MYPTAHLTNVKVSIKCEPVSLHTVLEKAQRRGYLTKERNNFIVFRKEFCCSLFKRKSNTQNNHVNITKIKSLPETDSILEELKLIGVICLPQTLVIDNITGQLNTQSTIDIRKLVTSNLQLAIEKCASDAVIHVKYNNENFPGAFFRIYKKNQKLGTSILFHSGKIVFVGCKQVEHLQCLASLTHAITLLKF